MVDFEQISDTFEDGFENVKEFTKKNKVLVIAICAVGAFALYKLYTDKKTSEDTEYVSTYAYVPTAYDGYPTMSESVSYDDVVEQLRTETADINKEFYDETMSSVSQLIEDIQEEKSKNIIYSNTSYGGSITTGSYLEEQRKREEVIAQMSANSEAWHTASEDERRLLEAENQELGASIGATFDSGTGTWSQDGESLYTVSVKNKTNTSTSELTNVGVTTSTIKNSTKKSSSKSSSTSSTGSNSTSEVLSQMKANSEAWHTASESERKNLEAKNQELGKSIGATYDSGSGTWSKNGTQLY